MEKLNIAEMLKDCPTGMELDCTMFDDAKFIRVEEDDKPICIRTGCTYRYLTKFGTWTFDENAKCVIFPKGKTTWEGFQKPFNNGDVLYNQGIKAFAIFNKQTDYATISHCFLNLLGNLRISHYHCKNLSDWRLATEEEKQKLFDAIKANGYKWNTETKTLEKLIIPKFKVGDRITNGKYSLTISHIDDGYYYEIEKEVTHRLSVEKQDDWELIPNKFDVSTLKTFDMVLVRNNSTDMWQPQFFNKFNSNMAYPFICLYNSWKQCIPYKGNEYLVNTNKNCNDYFII